MLKTLLILFFGVIIAHTGYVVAATPEAGSLEEAMKNSTKYYKFRFRHENAKDTNPATRTANAGTLRSEIGLTTGKFHGFSLDFGLEAVYVFGSGSYNSTTNGKTQYFTIPDPSLAQISKFAINYDYFDTKVKLGRQAINLDNQRMIGTDPLRQKSIVYDGLTITNNSIKDTTIFYGYITQINFIAGRFNPNIINRITGNFNLLNVKYTPFKWLNVSGYGYFFDQNKSNTYNQPVLADVSPGSYKITGLSLTGEYSVMDKLQVQYLAEAAQQNNYTTGAYIRKNDYLHIAPSIIYDVYSLTLGLEKLGHQEETGAAYSSKNFQSNYGSNYSFNGNAGVFVRNAHDGLKDSYIKFSYINTAIVNVDLTYHIFDATRSIAEKKYGEEIDIALSRELSEDFGLGLIENLGVSLMYSKFNKNDSSTASYVDTEKWWLSLTANF